MNSKIVTQSEISNVRPDMFGKKIVLAGGCYDILHYGHYAFLKAAADEGDILLIALESDEFIQKRKHRHPVHTQQQRSEILSGLSFVDYVIKLPYMKGDADYSGLVDLIKPSIIAITDGDPQQENKRMHAESVDAQIKIVTPVVKSFSTSSIIEYANLLRN